jgi:queuine tRNA-ribosyltransferase
MKFELIRTDTGSSARAGLMVTGHGVIETPIFMPVGTAGSVKGVHQRELSDDIGAQIILGNTYHLFLRPGMDILARAGGLHSFNQWDRPILTDSGGYQVYSLSAMRKIKEEGVTFHSHIDGSRHFFSPENVVDIQRSIGADIMMALDECPPANSEYRYAKESMELTHRWLKRGVAHFMKTEPLYGHPQSYFPIVQGAVFPDLRRISAEYASGFDMDGFAIGGLSVGEPAEKMYEMTSVVTAILPGHKPRYLMGVGTPANILESIALGVDMFDCVMPTRNGRNGMLFTSGGIINIKNNRWKEDFSPVDPDANTWVDTAYSRAYLRHLIISGEMLGAQIATIHNLGFYLWLVKEARRRILDGTFAKWKPGMVEAVSRRIS